MKRGKGGEERPLGTLRTINSTPSTVTRLYGRHIHQGIPQEERGGGTYQGIPQGITGGIYTRVYLRINLRDNFRDIHLGIP